MKKKLDAKTQRKLKSLQNQFIKAVNKQLFPYKWAREDYTSILGEGHIPVLVKKLPVHEGDTK